MTPFGLNEVGVEFATVTVCERVTFAFNVGTELVNLKHATGLPVSKSTRDEGTSIVCADLVLEFLEPIV